ncbi:MAG: TlpA family protein disulfide reductase [Crocinitomicaceae bacterium]|nr:TlpA family protein disulfide reductase [Crocinitomicaceae bacterium]MBK8925288.1 TlpA family protein disulfide reductase [Crocinitomicaceae bacterium]
MKNILIILSLMSVLSMNGQQPLYEVTGYAPGFVGKKMILYTYQDYITMTRIKLGECIVSSDDSLFHIPVKNKTTIKAILHCDKTETEFYLAPQTTYDVYFSEIPNQADGFQTKEADLFFFGLDSTDINYRIIQYNNWFDTYVAYYADSINPANFHEYLDTFKTYAAEAYKNIEDVYFLTYVRYNIAEMDQAFNTKGESRINIFLNYIHPFPVYYENDQYMQFVKRFFYEEFSNYVPDVENAIFLSLANSSPTQLMKALKGDLFLANPELRELMMIEKLGKAFYKETDFRMNILTILDSVSKYAAFPHSAVVAKNITNYLTSIEQGFPAPHISLSGTNGEIITWDKYRGKFVYFTFFETWNERSLAELKIIAELKKKYDEDIAFLSVCTDDTREGFDAFMKANPDLNWDIIYVGNDEALLNKFRVASVPAYYLIDQDGFIALAPAPGPSPDGEYESIDKTFFIIHEALHPNQPIKVGEK